MIGHFASSQTWPKSTAIGAMRRVPWARHEEAIADCDEAIHLQPDYPMAYNNRGNAKSALGRHDDAIADYNLAIRLQPDYAKAYSNRGGVKNTLGRHHDAIADCDEAIRLQPDYAEAYVNRGVAKADLGMIPAARRDCEIALGLSQVACNDRLKAHIERFIQKLDSAEQE